jgi:hypothetical protein
MLKWWLFIAYFLMNRMDFVLPIVLETCMK